MRKRLRLLGVAPATGRTVPIGRMIRRWINRDRGRYYIVVVTDDLFGGWNLQRFWGGCDSRRGGCLTQHLEDSEAIEAEMRRIAARRQKRDYGERRLET